MRIGVLGTGTVGRTIATKLRELGHDVLVGSRSAGDDAVPLPDAAAHSELVFNCTAGAASLEALGAAGEENLTGTEMYLPLWIRLMGALGTARFNIAVVQ